MSNNTEIFEIGDETVHIDLPRGAKITQAVVAVRYELDTPAGKAVGGQYGTSPMPMMDAVGLLRVTTLAVERDAV